MYSGCVLDQLTWQMQRSGLLTATARLVAQGETVAGTTAAGTPADLGLQALRPFQRRDHPQRTPRSATSSRPRSPMPTTSTGSRPSAATAASTGPIPSIAALTGRIEVRFADQHAGQPGHRRRALRAGASPMPCPRARASPSPCTPSICRARGSRSPGRRACRPPSTGRPPATPRSGGCAPPSSSTTSRSTDHAAPEPDRERPTGSTSPMGVRLLVAPLTTALMVAARTDPGCRGPARHGSPRGRWRWPWPRRSRAAPCSTGRASAMTTGDPLPVSPEGIDALLDIWPVFEAFQTDYVARGPGCWTRKKTSPRPRRLVLRRGRPLLRGLRRALPGLPARLNRPLTPEGWQVWDLVGRLGGQICAVIPGAVLGWDMGAALAMAAALGVDTLGRRRTAARDRGGDGAALNDRTAQQIGDGDLTHGREARLRPPGRGRAAVRCAPSWKASARPGRAALAGSPPRWNWPMPGSAALPARPGSRWPR